MKFSSTFAKFKIIWSKFLVSRNFDNAVSQPPYEGLECVGGGGGPVQPWLTLRTNADCPYLSSLYAVFFNILRKIIQILVRFVMKKLIKKVNFVSGFKTSRCCLYTYFSTNYKIYLFK